MTIDNYTIYTAKELREAMGLIHSLITIATAKTIDKDKPGFKFRENALEDTLVKIREKNVRDKLRYLYQFITQLAWLSKAVDRNDPIPYQDKDGDDV